MSLPHATSPRRPLLAATAAALALGPLAAGRPAGPQGDDPPAPPAPAAGTWLELPDDSIGRPWASVGPETAPWPYLTRPDSEPPDAEGEPWATWAADLHIVAWSDVAEEPSVPDRAAEARRQALARLCRLAVRDGRPADAYRWAQAIGPGDPEALAGVVPYLFPGLPFGAELGPAGRPGPLPAGAALRPLLPPETRRLPFGQIQWREATARGLRVGEVTFDLMVKVDGSGVVAEFQELGGAPGTVALTLPAPEGFRLKTLYVDWEKVPLPAGADPATIDWSTREVRVPLDPEDGSYSVFARLAPLASRLPSPPGPGILPAALAEAGLEVLVRADAPRSIDDVARAWGRAVGVPTRVERLAPGAHPTREPGAVRGVVLDLAAADDPDRLRRAVTGAIEARARGRR